MNEIEDHFRDLIRNKGYSIKITSRGGSRKTSKTKRLLWAKDLTEVLGESKIKNPSSSLENSNSEIF